MSALHEIRFFEAKNGEKTCAADGILLHSRYNPEKEAETFANSKNFDFEPRLIVVAGPALSYCAPFLRTKFPAAKLAAIEFCGEFSECASLFDDYFVAPTAEACAEAARKIFFKYGEAALFFSAFFSWPPSERAFRAESENCARELRRLVEMSAQSVATRTFFGKRWIKNSFKFFSAAKFFAIPAQKCEKPVLICASGKTLQASLPFIRARREEFFVIALSSALEVLFFAGISPDLAFSTDGGFYARRHIASKKIVENGIPLALSPESAANSEILEGAKILPLNYGDGASRFFDALGLPSVRAVRNGTVSGTALEFALQFSSGKIFFCGLDLAAGKFGGFSHAQPNACERADSQADFRLRPLATRLCAARGGSSLEIYAAWFESLSPEKKARILRIKSGCDVFERHLQGVSEADWENLPRQKPAKSPKLAEFSPKGGTSAALSKIAQGIEADFDLFCATGGGDFGEKWLEEFDFAFFLRWQKSGKTLKIDEKRKKAIKKLLEFARQKK